ncbi:putative esterase FE4-like [Penaeus vannamei]|uniref:Putative esterase FE4-like n=1 Tax=Penaeus vannamei TaxID=6689 RepID=A0A3R7Q9T1_PENVA|nr:putative esterase FE4-like [Penaeus vannamei]
MRLVVVIAALSHSAAAAPEETPVAMKEAVEVHLQQGAILGSRSEAEEGRFFYSFKNIPLRAAAGRGAEVQGPPPGAPWEGTRSGSGAVPMCPQAIGGTVVYGQEDCLSLSVYTPRVSGFGGEGVG